MLIAGFPAGPWGTNCYVAATGPGTECVVIDPGKDAADGVGQVVREQRLKPVAVLVTHGHVDHMWCVAPVAGTYDATAWIHPDDRHLLANPMAGMSAETTAMLLGGQARVRRARPRRGARGRPDASSWPASSSSSTTRRDTPRDRSPSARRTTTLHRPGRVSEVMFSGRPALRRLDRPHRPARRRPPDDAAQPAREGAHRFPTTSWCCPVTASRPASARERATNPFLLDLVDEDRAPSPVTRGL